MEENEQPIETDLTTIDETATPSLLAGVSQDRVDQLTKRNFRFMLDVDKLLRKGGLDLASCEVVYDEMVTTLIEGQAASQTAKQIYGTPSQTSEVILSKEIKTQTQEEPSPDWQIAIDGGLMLGSLFTIITGIFALNRKGQAGDQVYLMGLLTIILNYVVGGYAMMRTAKVLPDVDAPKGQKGYGKYILVSTLSMMAWVGLVMVSQAFLPPIINPILPPIAYLFIGSATLLIRFYLKKKWKIVGGIF